MPHVAPTQSARIQIPGNNGYRPRGMVSRYSKDTTHPVGNKLTNELGSTIWRAMYGSV